MLSVERSADVPADALGRLVRRARLLAADAETAGAGLRTTASEKLSQRRGGEVLWVVGAGATGGDSDADPCAGSGAGEPAGLRLARIFALMGDGELEAEPHLVSLARCRAGGAAGPCPPEALLHAVVPATHVAITQPDAIMALCDAVEGHRYAEACFGAQAAWVPYEAGAAPLARELGRATGEPGVELALLARRGLVTWGETGEAVHAATARAIARARAFAATAALAPSCGGQAFAPLGERERARVWDRLLPVLHRSLGTRRPKVLELDTTPAVLDFVCSRDAPTLAGEGPACAQQVPHTQQVPLWIDFDPRCDDAGDLAVRIVRGAARHRALARWRAAAFGGAAAPQRDPDARVVLIAGLGMVAAGVTRTDARRARYAYRHAIAAIGAAAALDRFVAPSAPECEAFQRALRAA